jgi:hypothetical protein
MFAGMAIATDAEKVLNSPGQGVKTVPHQLSTLGGWKKKVRCLEKFSSNFS